MQGCYSGIGSGDELGLACDGNNELCALLRPLQLQRHGLRLRPQPRRHAAVAHRCGHVHAVGTHQRRVAVRVPPEHPEGRLGVLPRSQLEREVLAVEIRVHHPPPHARVVLLLPQLNPHERICVRECREVVGTDDHDVHLCQGVRGYRGVRRKVKKGEVAFLCLPSIFSQHKSNLRGAACTLQSTQVSRHNPRTCATVPATDGDAGVPSAPSFSIANGFACERALSALALLTLLAALPLRPVSPQSPGRAEPGAWRCPDRLPAGWSEAG